MIRVISAFALMACAVVAHAGESSTVEIRKFAFTPQEITVKAGATVVWINQDETPHAIIASDGSFLSKALDTDDRYEHTFAAAGDFGYLCTLHPYMTGVVHVRP